MNSSQNLHTQFQIIGSLVLPMPSAGRSIVKDRRKRAENRKNLLKGLKRKARKKASPRRRRRSASARLPIFAKPAVVVATPVVVPAPVAATATISALRTKRKRSKAFRAPLRHTRPIDIATLAKELGVSAEKIVRECQLRGLKVRFATDRITNLVAQQIRDYLTFLKRGNLALATRPRRM